jgi:hypothetical protein
MCSPLNPLSCTDLIKHGIKDQAADAVSGLVQNNIAALLAGINDQLHVGIKAMATMLAGWILAPSTTVCPGGDRPGTDWIAACATGTSPAAQVRAWMLPLTVLIAVAGIVWQGITMTITRKGEPFLIVLKGLWSVALWGVVGIAGTQLALRAGDAYSYWILRQAIFGDSLNPVDDMGTAIANMSAGESYTAVLVLILLNIPILFVTVAQIILMIFREGAVVILAGQLQLAAAGSFTKLTSGWLGKLTGWMLALIAYKPVAASVYGVAFLLMGDGFRNLVMGLAVLIMALMAMPALMKFFNWSVGAVATQSNGLGMLGTSLAAGMHGASALRGLGGHGAAEHARYLDTHGPSSATGASDGGGPGPGGGGSSPGRPLTPTTPPPGGPGGAASSGLSSSTASGGAAAGAGASAAAGAASGGATVAAEAAVQAVQKARQAAQSAADTAGDTMQGP